MDLTFILPFIISVSTTLIGVTWGVSKKEEALKDKIDTAYNQLSERITLVESKLTTEISDIRHKKELSQREFVFFQEQVDRQHKMLMDKIESNFTRIYNNIESIKGYIHYRGLDLADKPTWTGQEKK